jgi:hypothetical protein
MHIGTYKHTYYDKDKVIHGRTMIWCDQGARHIISMIVHNLPMSTPTLFVHQSLQCLQHHTMSKGNYPTFRLPIEIVQLIEESLEDLRLLHNDD